MKTKAAHTPGPWKAKRVDSFHPYHEIVTVDYDVQVARVYETPDSMDSIDPQGKANARLIAAAPDLLAACRDALSIFGAPDWSAPRHLQAQRGEWEKRARDAIAEGGGA